MNEEKKKFRVLMEANIREEVEVDAITYEEAVAKARAMKKVGTAELAPTWVDTEACVEATGELTHQVIGECAWCNTMMVDREIPGQPWIYGGDPLNEHGGLVCYKCLMSDNGTPLNQVDRIIGENSWTKSTDYQEVESWARDMDWPAATRSRWTDAIARRLAELT